MKDYAALNQVRTVVKRAWFAKYLGGGEMAAKLEEALLSISLVWDLSTPAKEIVEKVREQDLSLIQALEGKCKDQILPLACKLARGLKIPAVVALLLNGRSTILNSVLKKETSGINAPIKKSEGGTGLTGKKVDNVVNVLYKQGEPGPNLLARKVDASVVNSFGRKVDGFDDSPEGTIVDLVLGMALAHTNSCILNKPGAKCKSLVKDESGDSWQGEGSSLHSLGSSGSYASLGYDNFKRLKDWESGSSESSQLKDFSKWDESFQTLKPTLDSSEWEEVTSKSRKKSIIAPVVVTRDVGDNKFRKTSSGGNEVEKSATSSPSNIVTLPAGHDGEYNCEIARKLLECLLLFSPRLSGHAQSPHLSPLLRAAQANDEALVCLLLDASAPVNDKDLDGNTALHWALRQATPVNRRTVNSHVVRRLLKAGANVKAGNKLGATPVHTAAGHGHFEALSDILDKDSSGVNVMAATKETPLHYAVKNNHIACTFLLLKNGANRNVASLRNQKPIHLAPSMEMKALLLQDDKVLKENTWESFKPILVNAGSLNYPQYSLAIQSQTQFSSIADTFGFHQSTQDGSTVDWLSAQTLAINSRDLNLGDSRTGGSQSDDGSDQSIKNFKTKLCTHHEKTGKCPHGAKCTFAHGLIEVRGALSSAAISIRPPTGIDTRPPSANSMGSSIGSDKGDEYISARKIFVGGLPHFIQSEDLWEFFEAEFGKVVDAVVICAVDVDGKVRSRGFGFVVFYDPRHANAAVKRHHLPFRGKKVEVKRAMARVDYGEEPIKLNSPTCPSASSSSIPAKSVSNSPTFGPSSPVLPRSKELSSVPSVVPQQAWSLPPLAVESLRKPSPESNEPSPNNSIPSPEMNKHVVSQYSAPSLSHLTLGHSGNSHLQNSLNQIYNFGPLFPQTSSYSPDPGLDRNSYLLDSGTGSFSPSPSYGFTSPSSASKRHYASINGSPVPYSNGTSSIKHDTYHPSQSFFSSIPGPSLYSYASDPVAPADEEEFTELLAMLQGERA